MYCRLTVLSPLLRHCLAPLSSSQTVFRTRLMPVKQWRGRREKRSICIRLRRTTSSNMHEISKTISLCIFWSEDCFQSSQTVHQCRRRLGQWKETVTGCEMQSRKGGRAGKAYCYGSTKRKKREKLGEETVHLFPFFFHEVWNISDWFHIVRFFSLPETMYLNTITDF